MTALTARSVRVDPAIVRALGQRAVDDVVALMSTEGDCDVCYRGLGPARLAISATRTTTGAVTVVPRHAACGPSTFDDGQAILAPPPRTHLYKNAIVPLQPAAGRGSAFRKPQAEQRAVVIINPSVDAQIGAVEDGRWVSALTRYADTSGLQVFGLSDSAPPSTWGAELDRTGTQLLLTGPADHYACTIDEAVGQLVRRSGVVQVVVVDRPHVSELDGGPDGLTPLVAAMERGVVWSAMAAVGAAPAPASMPLGAVSVPRADAHGRVPHPSGLGGSIRGPGSSDGETEWLETTDDVRAVMHDDTECEVAALFSDDPVLRAAGVVVDKPVPVLLVEPMQAVYAGQGDGTSRELRAETVMAQGLARWKGGPPPANPARDWSASWTSGQVRLTAPYGVVAAEAHMPEPPAGWLDAAASAGRVLVLYGVYVGVRAMPGKPMTHHRRRLELEAGRKQGFTAWSLVTWS